MAWLKEDLERRLDRQRTPWFIAVFHAPWCGRGCARMGERGMLGGRLHGVGGMPAIGWSNVRAIMRQERRRVGVHAAELPLLTRGSGARMPASHPRRLLPRHRHPRPCHQVHLVCGALL